MWARENLATTRPLGLTRVVSSLATTCGLWGLSLSGKDFWAGTQEAGFKSRSITTCSETLGKSFSLSCLPVPRLYSLHTDHTVAGKTLQGGTLRGARHTGGCH